MSSNINMNMMSMDTNEKEKNPFDDLDDMFGINDSKN